MMKKTHALILATVAGLTITFAAASQAEAMGPHHAAMSASDHAAMAESHVAQLKAQLNINPTQEAAWQAFADAAKQQAQSMHSAHSQAKQASAATAPEQLAQHAAAMQQHVAGMANVSNALTQLYAVLTPEQKAIVDQHFNAMHQHHGMHGGHAG